MFRLSKKQDSTFIYKHSNYPNYNLICLSKHPNEEYIHIIEESLKKIESNKLFENSINKSKFIDEKNFDNLHSKLNNNKYNIKNFDEYFICYGIYFSNDENFGDPVAQIYGGIRNK